MNYADQSADFQYLDGLEALTLRISGQADQVISQALSEPVGWKEAEVSQGQVRKGDVLFAWPVASTPTRPPLGSKLIDEDGAQWTILTIARKQHVECWEAGCRNLAVEAGLTNLVTILHATYTKSAGGEAVPTWSVLQANVAARIQPASQTAEILEDADWTRDERRVILQTDVDLELAGADYRIVDSAGVHYRVVGYQQAQRIDELPVAIVVKILEGREGHSSSSSGA